MTNTSSRILKVIDLTFAPWDVVQGEPALLEHWGDMYEIDGDWRTFWAEQMNDEGLATPAEIAAYILTRKLHVFTPSNCEPWSPFLRYVAASYEDPCTGTRTERSVHLTGFSDDESYRIYELVRASGS